MSKFNNNQEITTIITHPGVFHADDVFAVAWLKEVACIDKKVERTLPSPEDMQDINTLVLDIGGQYYSYRNNFDHHQREGAGVRDNNVPFAAFGLIAKHFPLENEEVQRRVESRLVEPIDAGDCGWGTLEGTRPVLTASAVISGFNPAGSASNEERNNSFDLAVEFARQILRNEISHAKEWVEGKEAVMSAPTPIMGVMVLDKFVPWSEHIFSKPRQEEILYVVFPSERGGWMVQQVPKVAGGFEGRKPLPKEWAGLRGEEFAKVACLAEWGNATFCHSGRFVAGAETKELALQLAKAAIAS